MTNTKYSEEDKKDLLARANRISGQITGIKNMINDDRECEEILIQLSAINKAVHSLSSLILEKHMKNTLGDHKNIDEVIDLFKRYQ